MTNKRDKKKLSEIKKALEFYNKLDIAFLIIALVLLFLSLLLASPRCYISCVSIPDVEKTVVKEESN